ncbi:MULTISPECIES: LuxR C-terminal-related transcriptional regulator [unclassified Streptomyces]|uniref:LuxR C-terminal-related transcriptional regulator n=1 Tax=unclassified Streptomyces TaxID=2593676 RepID=UPI0036F00BCC
MQRAQDHPKLSERECEVLDLVAGELTNRQISSHLLISERTVREYVARAHLKLRDHSRVQAAVIAAEWRLNDAAKPS